MNGRGLIAVSVLAAWGIGLGALAQRELSRSDVERLAEAAIRVSPVTSYSMVERNGRHVGFSSLTTDTVPAGLQLTDYSVTTDSSLPGGRRVQQVVVHASRSLVLRSIAVRDGELTATATVIDDSVLRVVRPRTDGSDTTRLTFRPPLLVPFLVPTVVALGAAPSVGDRQAWDVFDPATLRVRRATTHIRAESSWVVVDSAAFDAGARRWRGVHADTVTAWHVVEDPAVTGRIESWVDETGQLVAARSARGEERRTAYEVAFENWRSGASTIADPALARIDRRGVSLTRLVVLARGLPLERLKATNDWQHVMGDTVTVADAPVRAKASGYWLPPHRDHRARFSRELQVEPFIEVEAPVVIAAARQLRAREPDPLTTARVLARWVVDSIALDVTPTPPSAAATLRSRAGQAGHRVNLWIALARASGVPARPVLGVLATADGLVPHTWAEAWLGGTWIPVDLQRGVVPADASHLRLQFGSPTLLPEFERLLSRATLTVLDRTEP
ncbi:MAG: transglutaminase domain-containing protein [Gemmatimonadetes bacterium]|nr:transglutaminase domain-containing protein [Gemmatimonadota bacterium]